MSDSLKGLNEEQLQAVIATEGCVRVIAGAGSGKTRALTARFAYLVNDMGILPGSILCVTFTNKAANEMRRRIRNRIADSDTGYINTFHGFCVSVLQEDSHAVGYPESFLVLDNSDIDSMLRVIYEERGFTMRDMTFSAARDMIEIQKLLKKPDYYLDMVALPLDVLRQKYLDAVEVHDIIFYGYLYQEKKCFGLDYNDLLLFTLYIFEQNEDIKRKWQSRLEYIMIDEFQDIDAPQYRLMEVLADYHHNLFVVGDPDQTIYTWRGANVKYLLDFDKKFSHVQTVEMSRNYRSTPEILAAVNSLIARNRNRYKKDLIPMLPSGDKPLCFHAANTEAEAEWIADRILSLNEQGISNGDIAILYRAHYISRSLEEVFLRRQLPYTVYSGVQFFDRTEIKDALSYLRMAVYQDDLSFERICNTPRRSLGERRLSFLREYAENNACSLYTALKRNLEGELFRGTKGAEFVRLIDRFSAVCASMTVSELLSALLDESGYEAMLRTEGGQERLDNLAELKQSVYEFEASCGEETSPEFYLRHVALFSSADADAGRGDRVRLMTVHAAKGLEFPCVFLCGMNEGMFPSGKVRTKPEMEEERRLAFVAMTRAEKKLYLTEAEGRNLDSSPRFPSRFLLDIDRELLDFVQPLSPELLRDAADYIDARSRSLREEGEKCFLPVGTRVRHEIMGMGTVTAVDEKRRAHIVLFDGYPTPRAISLSARLEAAEAE